ncbi:MAG: IS481 family transposase [Candidatus Magasanikbacteria bacterium]|nr:IS481 family transposase [Candidatus Magasanikbacteria bacterium]
MGFNNYRVAMRKELLPKYDRWRAVGKQLKLSREAFCRLEWVIFHETKGKDVALTCRHFGIGRSTFYKWFEKFDEANLRTLETVSRRPMKVRERVAVPRKDERVIQLRKQYPYFGKKKLVTLYETRYGEAITDWYVQRVIEEYKLYFKKKKHQYTRRKSGVVKKKIADCQKQPVTGFLIHLDTIVLHLSGVKRYIVTGIDEHSKIAYARMYSSHSSGAAKDFFQRLYYLLDEKVKHVHTDNGSEFQKHFDQALRALSLTHWWSRPRTPKDNPSNERFNRTLRDEFLSWGNFHPDPTVFNQKLTNWLAEYNAIRPHETLDNLTPLSFAAQTMGLSTMWSSCTPVEGARNCLRKPGRRVLAFQQAPLLALLGGHLSHGCDGAH